MFVPPSGAPGFAGESVWDQGFSNDYFDNERVDRKSVRLEGRREMTSAVLGMQLADLVRSYLSVSCFVYLPTDDTSWIIDTSTSPRSRPPSTDMDTSLQPRPTWFISQHTLYTLRTASAYELSTQRVIGRNEGLGRCDLWRVVRGGAASE